MALHSPAVPTPDGQSAADDNTHPVTTQAAAPASIALKPESSVKHQTAVSHEEGAANPSVSSQSTSQPVVPQSIHIEDVQRDGSGTLTLGSNSPHAPQETANDAEKSHTSSPTVLDVVCADVRGVLMLDFAKMRCCIHYKGVSQQLQSFDASAGSAPSSPSGQHHSHAPLQDRT